MGPQEDLILIDTNIFVIDLRYKRDVNHIFNLEFLKDVAQRGNVTKPTLTPSSREPS